MRSTLPFVTTLAVALLALPGWARQSSGASPKTITISSGLAQQHRIGGDAPVYPPIAKAARVQGTVVLHASISKEGKVVDLRVVSGPPMLLDAATDAVRTWTYKPYLLNGEPVEVQTQINVVFTLGNSSAAAPLQIASGPSEGAGASGQPPPPRTETVTIPITGAPSDSASIPPPPPAHPVTPEQVHEILQLTGALRLAQQFLNGMMPAVRQQMPPYMPDDVFTDFQKSFTGANLEDAITRVYQEHISTEDAAAALAFYRTPAGQRMMAVQPTLERELQEQGRQLAVQTMTEVLERHKAEIDAARKQYEDSHLWTPPKN